MAPLKPLAIDLFTGLHGWAEGLVAEGFDVIAFDLEDMCSKFSAPRQPGVQLVLQDVLTLHGRQFKDAALIVASPPCQEYSYMAMPWARAKQIERALRGEDVFPAGYQGSQTVEDLKALFNACFRIQREACAAGGRHIPMVVENVKGAQPWVGRARWNFGSFYLWGDVPALMPIVRRRVSKNEGGSWFAISHNNVPHTRGDGIKQGGTWFHDANGISRTTSSKSPQRRMASALIAKIPVDLSRHIGRVYFPTA